MDWYKHDIGAYKRKTHGLTALEDGIYRRLLDEYYAMGGPLPNDLLMLKSLARIKTKWEVKAMSKVIDKFFPLNGDGYRHNERADQEIADYIKQCETNRRNRKGRTVDESLTNGQGFVPPSEVVSKSKKESACGAALPDGNKCQNLTAFWTRHGKPNGCREHGPF